jgi:hypothetical protein
LCRKFFGSAGTLTYKTACYSLFAIFYRFGSNSTLQAIPNASKFRQYRNITFQEIIRHPPSATVLGSAAAEPFFSPFERPQHIITTSIRFL